MWYTGLQTDTRTLFEKTGREWREWMMKRQTKKLIEENDILCEQLSKEANDVLRNMTGYIQRFGISRYEQEKVRQDIAEMILEGEKRGIPVKNTIGEDYQAFCESVLAEMPRMSSREKCLNVIRDICIFLAVWLPFWVFQYGGKDETVKVTSGGAAWAFLVFATGYVYSWIMSRQIFKKHIAYLLTGGVFIVIVLAGKVLTKFGYVLFPAPVYIVAAAEVILIIVCVVLSRIVDQDYKTL